VRHVQRAVLIPHGSPPVCAAILLAGNDQVMQMSEAVTLDKLARTWEREAAGLDYRGPGPCQEAERMRTCARELRAVLRTFANGIGKDSSRQGAG
jgi:hypothetical protein